MPEEPPADTSKEPAVPQSNTPPDDSVPQPEAVGTGNSGEPPDAASAEANSQPEPGASTTPLPELQGDALAPLGTGSLVGDRYEVLQLLASAPESNTYRVVDRRGYTRCWACGSNSSMEGDLYCVECGAQLTGRQYHLQEYPLVEGEEPPIPVPPQILDNMIEGVIHAYDILEAAGDGRAYVVWEEPHGRTLASWLPEAATAPSPVPATSGHLALADEPSEEQVLGWMAQVAELLARLHAQNIAGCKMQLGNLMVQPGDRVMLLDPSGCDVLPDDMPEQEREAAESADTRDLAAELERWYMGVRSATQVVAQSPSSEDAAKPGNGLRPGADAQTGPLALLQNPALLLSKARGGSFPTAEALATMLDQLYEASKPVVNLRLLSGRASDIGRVRQINEDSLLTLEASVIEHDGSTPVGVYVVADGMGGHDSGEVASSIAVRTIGSVINTGLVAPLVAGDPAAHDAATCANLVRQAVLEANRRICSLAGERHSDLGTTVVATFLLGNQLTVASVGDSRAYVWHAGQLTLITHDHSLVAQLVAAGQLTPDEIYTHPRRNEIYRALGDPRLNEDEIDVFSYRLQPGDSLLICSDGLWDFVRDPVIATTISNQETGDPQAVCQALVDLANERGGEDNISVILVRLVASHEE